jgi:hypothetical protein
MSGFVSFRFFELFLGISSFVRLLGEGVYPADEGEVAGHEVIELVRDEHAPHVQPVVGFGIESVRFGVWGVGCKM